MRAAGALGDAGAFSRAAVAAVARGAQARRCRLAELRPDQARLEQDHVDAEAAQLEAQRV